VIIMTVDLEKREKHEVGTTAAEQLSHSGPAFSPDIDIYTSDEGLILSVDLPGVGKGDVTIMVDETNSLVIRGKNTHTEPQNIVLRQYHVGNYYRAFQLSQEYDKDKISARLENGHLEVMVPKREEAKPRRIEIRA
jgi:HSP20 family protein